MVIKKIRFCFTFIFFLLNVAFAQTTSRDHQFETYNKLVGGDPTDLYNGTEFTDLFLNTNGTYRYFNGFDYTPGTVVYNGQYYVGVLLKYDVLEDNLLVRSDDNLSVFNIKLIPGFVQSFSVHGHQFVNITPAALDLSGNGFFEKAYEGTTLNLYIKRTKKKREKPLKNGIQYSFAAADFYVLEHDGSYSVVGNERDFRKIFPGKQDEIREYFKRYKSLLKLDSDRFYFNLTQFLDGQISQKKVQ